MHTKNKKYILIAAVAALVLVGLISALLILPGDPRAWLHFFVSERTPTWLFLALMMLLPIVGFPLTPFLLLIGLKLGTVWGVLYTALAVTVHLGVSYGLSQSFFRQGLNRLLNHFSFELPNIKTRRQLPFALLFMVVPGLPYAVKNYTLALLQIPFPIYFLAGFCCNLLLALPFIGLGSAMLKEPKILVACVLLLLALAMLTRWIKNKATG